MKQIEKEVLKEFKDEWLKKECLNDLKTIIKLTQQKTAKAIINERKQHEKEICEKINKWGEEKSKLLGEIIILKGKHEKELDSLGEQIVLMNKEMLKTEKELEDLRNDIKLAKQCVVFKGCICDNKDCKNINCSMNEKEEKK